MKEHVEFGKKLIAVGMIVLTFIWQKNLQGCLPIVV